MIILPDWNYPKTILDKRKNPTIENNSKMDQTVCHHERRSDTRAERICNSSPLGPL